MCKKCIMIITVFVALLCEAKLAFPQYTQIFIFNAYLNRGYIERIKNPLCDSSCEYLSHYDFNISDMTAL